MIASGRKCYTIGNKWLWTGAGWFDYLNLRTNGFDFHMQMAAGEIEWTDPRVRETFDNWGKLIRMGAFIDDNQNKDWQQSLPFIIDGSAGAILMGNFAVAPLRDGGLTDDQLDFPSVSGNHSWCCDGRRCSNRYISYCSQCQKQR